MTGIGRTLAGAAAALVALLPAAPLAAQARHIYGTIPLKSQWDAFAARCANFAAASQGCTTWVIGNETNLSGEWPADANGYRKYVSPEDYADCFRRVYGAIKAVRPSHSVVPQALAPFAGPYGSGSDHDGMPIDHVTYMRRMLDAIRASGPVDGIAVHITSRGYGAALLEVDRWNHNEALADGKPIIRCLNFYRWCGSCDGWNIDLAPQEGQILADLDEAVRYELAWPERSAPPQAPFAVEVARETPPLQKESAPYRGVWRSYPFEVAGSAPVQATFELTGAASAGGDDDDARLLVDADDPAEGATWNTAASLDGARDQGSTATARLTRTLAPGLHVARLQVDGTPYIERIAVSVPAAAARFQRGDANSDRVVDLSDAVLVLLYLFGGSRTPPCLDAADADDRGAIDVTDAIYLLAYLFTGGPAPPAPAACGADPTADGLAPCQGDRC
ncbi:MAG: hypothetical protein HY721_13680 [Planctomycetes bacterium]|nr:hypothetical protein [Planctomycetota bacterium]